MRKNYSRLKWPSGLLEIMKDARHTHIVSLELSSRLNNVMELSSRLGDQMKCNAFLLAIIYINAGIELH